MQTGAPRLSRRPLAGSRGFTLVELMIGIVVGFIVLAGVIAVYLTVVRGSTDVARDARLNQETRAALNLMVNDIRRAGYWRNAKPFDPAVDDDIVFNPFMNRDPNTDKPESRGVRDIHIHNGGTCIMLSYDPTFDDGGDEVFGYRLVRPNDVGWIEMFGGDPDSETIECNQPEGWTRVTDPNQVIVTGLAFDFGGSRCLNTSKFNSAEGQLWNWVAGPDADIPPCESPPTNAADSQNVLLESRQINISLEAQHARDPNIRIRLIESEGERVRVHVRNDRIFRATD